MSIAVICPIGTLAENGYQHVAEPCIKSMAEFANVVYLIQSHQDNRNMDWLPGNVRLISNPDTWLPGSYDNDHLSRNLDKGFAMAKDEGHAAGLYMASNSYIPKHHMKALRISINIFLDGNRSWKYYYRGNLLGGKLYRPSKRLPYIVNLRYFPDTRVSFVPDGLYDNDEFMPPEYGDYPEYESRSVIDIPLEMTLPEFAAKMNWVRCFADVMPKRSPVMDWGYWSKYHAEKVSRWQLSSEALDNYGQEIASRLQPDFISHEILEMQA